MQCPLTILSLFVLTLPLAAQGGDSFFDVRVTGGVNYALSHQPVYEYRSSDAGDPGAGWRFGLAGTLNGAAGKHALLFGVDVIKDRIKLRNFREVSATGISFVRSEIPISERFGLLVVDETHLRFRLAHQITAGRLDLSYGMFLSTFLNGFQRFNYTEIIRGEVNPATRELVFFAEEVVTEGTDDFPEEALKDNAYAGGVFSVSFQVTAGISVGTEVELGVNLANETFIANRYKQRHVRCGLILAYSISGQ